MKLFLIILLYFVNTAYSQEVTKVFEYENDDFTGPYKFQNKVVYDIKKKTFNIYSQNNKNLEATILEVKLLDGELVFRCDANSRKITCYIHKDSVSIFYTINNEVHFILMN